MKHSYSIIFDLGDIHKLYDNEVSMIIDILGKDMSSNVYDLANTVGIDIISRKNEVNKSLPLKSIGIKSTDISYLNVMKIALIIRIYKELESADNPPDISVIFKSKSFKVYQSEKTIDKIITFNFEQDDFKDKEQHYKALVLNGNIVCIYKASIQTNYNLLMSSKHSLINSDHKLKPNTYEILSETISNISAITGIIDINESIDIKFQEKANEQNSIITLTPGFNIHNIAKAIINLNNTCVRAQDLLTQSINNHKVSEIDKTLQLIETRIVDKIDIPSNVKLNSKMHVEYDGKNYIISLGFDGYVLSRYLPNVFNLSDIDCINIAEQIKYKAIQLFSKPDNK